jgi:integrase
MRTRKRRYLTGCIRNVSGSWILKYYDPKGHQRTHTLGRSTGTDRISKSEVERRRDEFVRPLNESRRQQRQETTFGSFVLTMYLPERRDAEMESVRQGTIDNEEQRLKAYILPVLGQIRFEDLEQDDLRKTLKAARRLSNDADLPRLGQEMLRKLRSDLIRICRKASGKGYLDRPIWEGLDRAESLKPANQKKTASMEQYVEAWLIQEARDRLAFDLAGLVGLRESEVYALQCQDIRADGIDVCRSLYKGVVNNPKTKGSRRFVGVPEAILARLRAYIERLPANGPGAWLFPSTTLITPEWPENAMKNRIRPRLANAGYHWLNFAVLRRTFSSAHRKRGTDLDMMAHQQGHDKATHLREYVQYDPAQLTAEVEKLHSDFVEVLSKKGKAG